MAIVLQPSLPSQDPLDETNTMASEKAPLFEPQRIRATTPPRSRFDERFGSLYLVLVGVLGTIAVSQISTSAWFSASPPVEVRIPEYFAWEKATAKPHLDYHQCFDSFQCARLDLPMDYWNGTTDARISLAVIRKPAVVPVTDPRYGGAILLNPGGPGGSGVGLLLGAAEPIRAVVDAEGKDGKFFDLISFDPRGVGVSTPSPHCFRDPGYQESFNLRVVEEGWFESSNAAEGRLWSMSAAKGMNCDFEPKDGSEDIKKYVTTISAARDMLEIVEAHGQWREAEALRLLRIQNNMKPKRSIVVPEDIKHKAGKEKLQYWGYSYGSYLGGTFAAAFPDRVERLIVDGVVNYVNYAHALWSDNLIDTEKTMASFYYHCARVGYPTCALAKKEGKTLPEDVENRVAGLLKKLYHNPLPVPGPEGNADVITYSNIRTIIFSILYSPLQFPAMAKLLAMVDEKSEDLQAPLIGSNYCTGNAAARLGNDAQLAIACGDGDDQTSLNRTGFRDFVKKMEAVSPTSGSIWSTLRMQCAHYRTRAVHRFTGPWGGNTSHPLLFIGNTADPVTPGLYARQMARGYKGAVTLMQNSPGHCSISVFSSCTMGYVRQYFQTGELPPVNTTCEVDVQPFGNDDAEIMSAELRAKSKAHAQIADAVLEHGTGFVSAMPHADIRNMLLGV